MANILLEPSIVPISLPFLSMNRKLSPMAAAYVPNSLRNRNMPTSTEYTYLYLEEMKMRLLENGGSEVRILL